LISLLTRVPISAKCDGGFCKAGTWELSGTRERWWPSALHWEVPPLGAHRHRVKGCLLGNNPCGRRCREGSNCRHFSSGWY